MAEDPILLTFPEGLQGFPEHRTFRLFEPQGGYPLKFLQAVEAPELSFVCMDAAAVKMDYEVPLPEEDAQSLELTVPDDAMILVLLVVPEDPRLMTANLAGPLVVNARTRAGRQIHLDPASYPLQYPVFGARQEVLIQFPQGLIGFPGLHTFRLYEPQGSYPLKFLQAVEDEDLSFTAIDVAAIQPELNIPLQPEEAQALALEDPKDALILALVVIPEDPRQMTANLAGPLVINVRTLRGRQLALPTEQFPLQFPVLGDR